MVQRSPLVRPIEIAHRGIGNKCGGTARGWRILHEMPVLMQFCHFCIHDCTDLAAREIRFCLECWRELGTPCTGKNALEPCTKIPELLKLDFAQTLPHALDKECVDVIGPQFIFR